LIASSASREDRENVTSNLVRKSLESHSSARHSENEREEEDDAHHHQVPHHKSTKKVTKPKVPTSLLKPTQASERKSTDDFHQIIHEHITNKNQSVKHVKGTTLKQQSSKKRSNSTPR
jgi:hypothetical protein